MALNLRPYQRESINAVYEFWGDGGGNPLVVIPTGGGKSLILSTVCRELLEDYKEMRIGIVTHVKELVQQNAEEIFRIWPGAPIGIYSAGMGRRDVRSQVLFMGIQSVHSKAHILGNFDLLIVDEAHLIPRNSDTMYGRFIADCRERTPDMRLLGLTATPYRLDSGRLEDGDGAMFDSIAYEANVRDLIEQGYLSSLISKATLAQIDMTGVHRRAGEFVQAEMDERARIPTVVEAAVREIVEAGQDRAGWLIFCTSVEHAAQVRDEIRRHNISCESVTGSTPAGERDRIIRSYKARHIRCLTSVGVLTTGFNAPHVDLIAMLRPTLSTGLYVQMVGRAFRLAPGKENALILDFAGNVSRHGPIDAVRPREQGAARKKREEGGEPEDETAKVKVCPQCRAHNDPGALICYHCGFEWPPEPPKHKPVAEEEPILTTEKTKPKDIAIKRVWFKRHRKTDMPDSMKITYDTSHSDSYSQWVCFEHKGFARDKAVSWWRRMGGKMPIPGTVTEALGRVDAEIASVVSITVRKVGQYPEVLNVKLGDPHSGASRVRADDPYEHAMRGSWAMRPPPMSDEKRKKLDIIVSLRAKTIANGCTPAEVATAANKAQAMMNQYGITEAQVVMEEDIPF